jgi:nicotinamide mononucleotide transporter
MGQLTTMDKLLQAMQAMSLWEVTAVVLAIAYLLLALGQRRACWVAAFISTSIYLVIFYQAKLYMEAALQIYYLLMAVYGWMQWHGDNAADTLPVTRWPLQYHVFSIAAVALATLLSGYLLANNTEAAMPYLDSFTTWAALITTYMVTRKILENWLYWVVIDAVSIHLYLQRDLYLTSALFALYVVIAVAGYFSWRRSMTNHAHSS